ncbi:hypothetical protein PBRA_008556 [Plasmodiophora brassicae]|uniref:Uncharacterized protein n=1 Tax=Plasmodiophora brassicae TaxID=37360 RepID=A0A0G4J2R4_PLABS|nr:hypothetical protein PBRA_008556 [Plasmodiophora brassicae]
MDRARLASPFALIVVVVLAGARTDAVALRSSDGVVHHVATSDAVAQSGLLNRLLGVIGEDDLVPLSAVGNSELRLIVEFVNATARHDQSDFAAAAARWVRRRLSGAGPDAQCRFLTAADYLDMRSLMVAIASTKRTWGDVVAMREEMLSPNAHRFVVDNAPGVVRLGQVASTNSQQELVERIRHHLAAGDGGGDIAFVNSVRWNRLGNVLHWAASQGEDLIAELLLSAPDIDVNARCTKSFGTPVSGNTFLHLAAKSGHANVVRLLLKVPGIDVNTRDGSGMTALHWAVVNASRRVVALLLEAPGIDVNARELRFRWTPLHWACELGLVPIVGLLLNAPDIDVNLADCQTMLYASWSGHNGIVELLQNATTSCTTPEPYHS